MTHSRTLQARLEAWIRHGEAVPADITTYDRATVNAELREMIRSVQAEPVEVDATQTVLVSWSGKRHYRLPGGRVLHDGSARAMCSDATYGKEPDADGDVTWGTKRGRPADGLSLCKSCARSAAATGQR